MKIEELKYECLTDLDEKTVGELIEKCARNCYKSEDKAEEDSYKRMIKMLISNKHEAMLEHFSITFKLTTDLHSYKDLTRHRHASFAIESTRWCNYAGKKQMAFIEPYGLKDNEEAYAIWKKTCEDCEDNYAKMIDKEATIDQASQILNQSVKADVIITANIREWRYILKLRTAKNVYPNLRFLMEQVLEYLQEKLPVFFGDINQDEEPVVKKETKEYVSLMELAGANNDGNETAQKARDIATKLFSYKRVRDAITGINDADQLTSWIIGVGIRQLQSLCFIVKIIENEFTKKTSNPSYRYIINFKTTGSFEFTVMRGDSGVLTKKLKKYFEKYGKDFPGLEEPEYHGSLMRFN